MPAFTSNKTDGPGTVVDDQDVQGSKFLPKGKYFLLVLLLLCYAAGAFVFIDEHYSDIYVFIFGSMPDHSTTYLMDEIIANPYGSNANRFLVVQIGMELQHHKHIELVESNMMKIKDRFNEVLSSRTVRELIQNEEREKLRKELADEVNQAIGVQSVRNLYFTKYIMQ